MKKLNQLKIGQVAHIQTIKIESDQNLGIRLSHLGFLENESISVLKKTPLTGDALLVSIRGTQMALTKKEADIVEVYICLQN